MAQLRDISVQNPVSNAVVEELYNAAPILQDIEFYQQDGGAPLIKTGREPDSGEVGFRNINEDQVATGPTRPEVPQPKKIIGFEAKVDRVLEDRNEDVDAELEQETRLKAQEAGYILQDKIFEGNSAVNPKEFDGLRALATNGKVVTPVEPVVFELGGDDKLLSQQVAFETLMNFFSRIPMGATHAYVNANLLNRLMIIAKHLGYYRMSKDDLGNQIEMIGDVIVRSAGRRYNGDAHLGFDKTVGANADTGDIIAVRHGERRFLTALTSVGVNADFEGLRGKFYVNTMDLDMTLVLQHDAAVWVLKNVRMPAANAA